MRHHGQVSVTYSGCQLTTLAAAAPRTHANTQAS